MANEITIRTGLAYTKGTSGSFDFGDLLVTMTGTEAIESIQACSTEEALNLGDVVAGGAWFVVKNLDATNNLIVRPHTGVTPMMEVRPGEVQGPIRFPSTTTAPTVAASAGTVRFIYMLVEA